jgi:YcxB-like protein
MTVTFTLTLDDHTAYVLYQVQHGPRLGQGQWSGRMPGWVRRLLQVLGLLLLAGGITLQLVLFIKGGGWDLSLVAGCLGLGMLCYQLLFIGKTVETTIKATLRRQYANGELDRLLGEQRLELRANEYILTTNYNTSAIAWSSVEKIVTTPEHAFIYHGEHGFNILPKHAFASEEEFTTFVETARAYQEAADRSQAHPLLPDGPAGPEVSRRTGMVEVVFKLTPEDGIEQLRQPSLQAAWSNIFGFRRQRLVLAFMMSALLALVLWQTVVVAQVAVLAAMLGALFAIPLLWILVTMLYPRNPRMLQLMKRYMAKQRYFSEATHRMRLTPDNLIYAVDAQVKATPWTAVEKILTGTDHAFFHISRTEILTLPKRAFAQEQEFINFVETANEYHQAWERKGER